MGNPVVFVDPSGEEPWKMYSSLDLAMAELKKDILPRSKRLDREFAGWLYKAPNGMFFYDEPTEYFEHATIARDPIDPDHACLRYHTHGAESGPNWFDEQVSDNDVKICKRYRRVFGKNLQCVVFVPSGRELNY